MYQLVKAAVFVTVTGTMSVCLTARLIMLTFTLRTNTKPKGWKPPSADRKPFLLSLKAQVSWLNLMIRSGVNAYRAEMHVMGERDYEADAGPVWCAQRFGQSLTMLPDGRVVQVGGEHEDYYDSDFCIYNDVFVHDREGGVTIYGYPESVFQPTDSHTTTLIGGHIYLIGSIGCQGTRRPRVTPVYRLDTVTFKMDCLETSGDNPGWIYRHRAEWVGGNVIRVTGGKVMTKAGGTDNTTAFVLDAASLSWSVDGHKRS
jgi:hypothetical protein